MGVIQRYVSAELSHFVGRGKSKEDQYDILVNKILKTGWLTHPPHDPTAPRGVSLDLSKSISTDEMIKYQVVCFCDIPEPDLAIHTAKYSKFGLAFRKEFLIDQGACPVFYVANEGSVPITSVFLPGDFLPRIEAARKRGVVDRALYFDTSVRAIIDLLAAFEGLACDDNHRYIKGVASRDQMKRLKVLLSLSDEQLSAASAALQGNEQAIKTARMCIDFLLNHMFTYIKCVDAKRPVHDADNYYMEREWRLGKNLQFALDDVRRIFLPTSYAKRFRSDLPTYAAQVTLFD